VSYSERPLVAGSQTLAGAALGHFQPLRLVVQGPERDSGGAIGYLEARSHSSLPTLSVSATI
jgi:hypothetical protein